MNNFNSNKTQVQAFLLWKEFIPVIVTSAIGTHDKSDSFIFFIKGKEETAMLGCYRANKKYLYITCMKPELRESYDERENELKEGEVITDKEFTNDLSETANFQCICAGR